MSRTNELLTLAPTAQIGLSLRLSWVIERVSDRAFRFGKVLRRRRRGSVTTRKPTSPALVRVRLRGDVETV